ncbi:phosphoribosylanthranilate isomerase [Daejeonella sp.]|jgi:phosphoribosylanthranilate isomerase|uniref:phosphoribosylanthranilate isomerase n=1 Tax=Daejeonella sp. TaxID=2805397 RepID=UPI00378374BE
MKIKVCGMRDPENIVQLAKLNPDYLGLIFYRPSKRFVSNPDKDVLNSLPKSIKLVGVFVDEEIGEVLNKVKEYDLSAVQLHGSESPIYCQQLKKELSIRMSFKKIDLLKAFGLSTSFDFAVLKPFADAVDYFLFDTKTTEHGGSGLTFDWQILRAYTEEKPFFLSGGLAPENIKEIHDLAFDQLYGLDLNSRFESAPGLKDIESLQSTFEFIRK